MNGRLTGLALTVIGGLLAVTLLLPLLLPGITGTMPHAHCYLWRTDLMWLHGGSDGLIGLAYMAISITLFLLLYRIRESIPFRWMIFAFGVFIIACGMTHFLSVWTLWDPLYFLSGSVKGITAIASIVTAIALPPLVPRVIETVENARQSEERRMELEVLYSRVRELDEEKTRFFANVSHDLRTPISLILSPASDLLEQNDLPEDVEQKLRTIARNAHVLTEQVDDLLAISRLDAGDVELQEEEINILQLCRTVISGFESAAAGDRIDLSVDGPEDLRILADRRKFERILQNLLGNALNHTPAGGRVDVRIAKEAEGVTIEVVDNGPGVPPEMREKIFERYAQVTRPGNLQGGTGLGLSIVRNFTLHHGGSVGVSDAPGGGALFRISLPPERTLRAVDPPLEVPSVPQETLPEGLENPSTVSKDVPEAGTTDARAVVLLIEDNDDMREHVAEILSRDFQVVAAPDGAQGLEYLSRNRPSVVVSDIMMPGMGGEELLYRIRGVEEMKDLPVVFLSARGEEETRLRLLDSGAQDYISKPFSPANLRSRVAGFVAIDTYQQELKQHIAEKENDLRAAEQEIERKRELLEETIGKLRGMQSRFDLLWNSNIVAMGISHFDGRISEGNDMFLEMVGYTREELQEGKISIDVLTHPDYTTETEYAIDSLRRRAVIEPFEKSYRHRDGTEIPVIVGGAHITGSSDEVLFVAQDLTTVREAERKIRRLNEELEERVLQRTRELEALNRDLRAFSYSVSHDLRSPLRAISGFTRFLNEDYSRFLDDTGRDYLSRIERNVLVMEEMITALLGLSRATREEIVPVEHRVNDAIQEILDSLRAADPERNVSVEIAPDIRVEADRKLFRIVLENVVHNAWKFTGNMPEGIIRISGQETPDSWVISIRDNGAGFDQKKADRMFEPFGRLHSASEFAGTGIGLTTVQTILRRHSGKIVAESTPGEGATFTMTLPRPARVETRGDDGES